MALMSKAMRLDKFIASMGYGTRKEIKIAIRRSLVTVDGQIIKDAGFSVVAGEMVVKYKGEVITYEDYQYYMMHKPAGAITATEDKKQETVLDLLGEEHRKDLFPVGRLDKDTEGLLLITNDGDLCHNLLAPKKHVDKCYYAKIDGKVTEEDVKAFREGVELDTGYVTKPAILEILKSDDLSEINITIREGKFHQIKKMFQAMEKEVLYLKRLSMGTLQLDETLAKGAYRRLTEQELEDLKTIHEIN